MKMTDTPGFPASGSLFGPTLFRTAACLQNVRTTATTNVTMIIMC